MSYAGETSTLEVTSLRAPLEIDTALLLGQLMIGRSRLDLAIQLYVAALPAQPGDAGKTFDARLGRLLALADSLADKALRTDFVRWIVRARHLGPLAESLRDARWLPDPRRNVVLVLRQPTPSAPANRSVTVADLQGAVDEQKDLLSELHRLCAVERGITGAGVASFLGTQPIDVLEQA